MSVNKRVQRITDTEQQQRETYLYWQSLPVGDRLSAVWDVSEAAYSFAAAFKGVRPMMPKDLKDLLRAFNDHSVRYLVVGGYAFGVHAEPRATKDLDLLIRSDEANSAAVYRALPNMEAPLDGVYPQDFVDGFSIPDRPTPCARGHPAAHRWSHFRRGLAEPN